MVVIIVVAAALYPIMSHGVNLINYSGGERQRLKVDIKSYNIIPFVETDIRMDFNNGEILYIL